MNSLDIEDINKLTVDHHTHPLLQQHPHFVEADKTTEKNPKKTIIKSILGTMIFIFVFIFFIPFFIKKLNNVDLLLVYLMNIDLIATVLNFKDGPFNIQLFKYLYIDDRPWIGYIHQNIINLFVLSFITYVVTSEAVKNNNVYDGVARATIIFTITYLFAPRLVSVFMYLVYNFLSQHFKLGNEVIIRLITSFFGLIFCILLLIFEIFTTKKIYKTLSSFFKKYLPYILK